MPVQVSCPACGATVHFQSAGSALAVCSYCHSALARDGETLKNLGRMAELLADDSPLQIGSRGQWRGRAFSVVGRLQLRYDAGFWNEWHILFADGRFGWLSEAGGQWTLTYLAATPANCPSFEALTPGTRLMLGKAEFEVTNREEAVCLSGEGELPFAVGPGYVAPVVDLRAGGYFASLDFSGNPPQCYVGEAVARDTLKLNNLRDRAAEALIGATNKKAQALSCPSCGSPWTLHDKSILAVACPACGTLSDVEGNVAKVREAAQGALQLEPTLPLGTKGTLEGVQWEAIGYMRKGCGYDHWEEYLLYDGNGGFAWLVTERGHWNFVRQLNTQPQHVAGGTRPCYKVGNTQFEQYASYDAEVLGVLGEFTWRVALGDTVKVIDFVAPPEVLSCERTESEITWSMGCYLDHRELAKAFGQTDFAKPEGVNACQPNPYMGKRGPVTLTFLGFVVLAYIAHKLISPDGSTALFSNQIELQPGQETTITSEPFQIKRTQPRLKLAHFVPVSNTWADLDVELVNRQSGDTFAATHEVAYYSGYEDGESWAEGQQDAEVVFKQVPPGEYNLVLRGELAADASSPVSDRVTLIPEPAPFSNLIFCWLYLSILPIWVWVRRSTFETKRWSNSDFSLAASSDDGDDD